jgi:hypothetical protein
VPVSSDAAETYENVSDKGVASKKDSFFFVQGATDHYKTAKFATPEDAERTFFEEFYDWTEEDFNVAKLHIGSILDILLTLGVQIHREARLK